MTGCYFYDSPATLDGFFWLFRSRFSGKGKKRNEEINLESNCGRNGQAGDDTPGSRREAASDDEKAD